MLLSKSYEIQRVKMKVLFFSLFLFLNTICILQQFKMFLNNFFNLVLVCEDMNYTLDVSPHTQNNLKKSLENTEFV